MNELLGVTELTHHAVDMKSAEDALFLILGSFRDEFAHFRDGNRGENAHEQEDKSDETYPWCR